MPYNRKTQESLKDLIYRGKIKEFQTQFEQIKSSDPAEAAEYLRGTKDEGRGLLAWAAMPAGCSELIPYLISCHADINQQDGKDRTALFLATDRGNLDSMRELLKEQADPALCDFRGDTALHVAAHGSNSTNSVIELLLAEGMNVNVQNKQGATPFHVAAKYSLEAMHTIVKYKAKDVDINKSDLNGDTPLHYAATSETHGKNATYLLMLGANRTLTNSEELTPAQEADNWDSGGDDYKAIIGFAPRKGDNPETFYLHVMEEEIEALLGSCEASAHQ